MKFAIPAVTLSLLFSVQANAQSVTDAANAITQGWSGSATLGASSASGIVDTSSISGDIRLGKAVGRWEHLVFGLIFKGNSSIIVEKENPDGTPVLASDGKPQREIIKGDASDRIALGYQPKYYWRPRTYLFGLLDWETDKPANIDSLTRQIIGVGHKFWTNDEGFLSGELGFGNKVHEQVSGGDLDGAIGYAGLNFVRKFAENATFNADFRSDFGDENTFVEIGLGLAFKVAEGMAIKISHYTRNNSDLSEVGNPVDEAGNIIDSSSESVTGLNLVFDI